MIKWFHKVDLGWLMARQDCLTATDVKDLLPITKTGRKRVVAEDAYLGVLAKKLQVLTDEDCESTGAAARGHVLEPYAIKMYNEEMSVQPGLPKLLFHWDDIVITRRPFKRFSLGFSPDALDAKPPKDRGMFCGNFGNEFKRIGEVKSYYPTKHLVCANTPADQLEERWQIAVAMAVCETIEEGRLLFYNPSMPKDMLYVVEYDRADLADEIDMVLDVEDKWLTFVENYVPLNEVYVGGPLEQDIIAKIMKNEELNPEGERSVIR